MYRYFATFWWIYVSLTSTGVFLIINYLTNSAINLVFLFKIPLLVMFLILLIFHMKYKIHVSIVTLLFGLFSVIAVGVGLVRGSLLSASSLNHIYMAIMSILAVSFGYYFAKNYNIKIDRMMKRVITTIFKISVMVMVLYYYLFYFAKRINYFGFDSYLPLVSAMLLAQRKYKSYVAVLALVFFSGKRAPLIAMLIPVFILVLRSIKKPKVNNLIKVATLIIVIVIGIFIALRSGLGYRFDAILALDIKDSDQLYIATSGRSDELAGLVMHLKKTPILIYLGSGFGAEYIKESFFRGVYSYELRHYLHLALLTHLLVFGVIFLVCILIYIAYILWRNRFRINNFYFLAFVVTLVGSLFGASIVVDPIFWFFLGVNAYMTKCGCNAPILTLTSTSRKPRSSEIEKVTTIAAEYAK